MLYIIPYTKYKTRSSLSKKNIISRVSNSVHIVQSLSAVKSNSYRDFEGVIAESGFSLRRIIKLGYSSFLPILSCEIYEEKKNVYLIATIQFHKTVNILTILFFVMHIMFVVLGSFSAISLILFYCFVVYIFNKEVTVLKEKFDSLSDPDPARIETESE